MFLNRKKTTTKRRLLFSAVQIFFFIVLFMIVRHWTQQDMVVGPAPNVVTTDLQGEKVSLSEYQGEPFLLTFWASWCRICKFEQGAVNSVNKSWPVLSVAMQSGDRDEVTEFLQSRGLTWRTLLDESGELAKRYGVPGVPAHFIIDAHGNIRFREMGYTTTLGLKARLWITKVFYAES